MNSYSRDALLGFIIVVGLLAGLAAILFFVNKGGDRDTITERQRIAACRTVESEALRTMCINGHG